MSQDTLRQAQQETVPSEDKMSPGDILSYGVGGITATMTNQFKLQFHMNFLSDVAGMPILTVGAWSMLLTIWDAINDPIIGRLADRTNTRRFGKYRPHMMMGSIFLAFTLLMMFSVPNLSMTGKLIYYIFALAIFSVFSTQFTVPWQALNSVMSQDAHQRNLLLTSRQFVGAFATSAVGLFVLPVVERFENPRTGWLAAAAIVGVAAVICGFLSANGAKKKDYYNSLPTPKGVRAKGQMQMIFQNRALLIACLLRGGVYLGISLNSVINLYYLRYVVKNVDILPTISLIRIITGFAFLPFMPALMRRFGKAKVLGAGMLLYALPAAWLFFLRENATPFQVIVMSSVKSVGITYANVCCFALVPDCTDYTELNFGTAQAGFINAIGTFVRKFVGSFATLIVGGLLELAGYVGGAAMTAPVVEMILNINIWSPILLCALCILLIFLYPITPAYAVEMRKKLRELRAGGAA